MKHTQEAVLIMMKSTGQHFKHCTNVT